MKLSERKQKAIKLRKAGWLYKDIGAELGISATMARKYFVGDKYTRPTSESRENSPHRCNKIRPSYTERCVRYREHKGVHLSDQTGQLIYWESN